MEFVKKNFIKILCLVILVSTFFPFVTFYGQAVENGQVYGDKEYAASVNLASMVFKSGFFVTLVPACALIALVFESINRNKLTSVFGVVGFISLLIAPSSIHNQFINDVLKGSPHYLGDDMMYDDHGILCKLITERSVGFVIMLICFILLILISLIRLGLLSNKSTTPSSNLADDSKVDLNK